MFAQGRPPDHRHLRSGRFQLVLGVQHDVIATLNYHSAFEKPLTMNSRFIFHILQLRKRLWAKPLLYCLLAMGAAFVAQLADHWGLGKYAPEISEDTVLTLLTIISSSMLAVATFAVGSMVSAYNSASESATPRAFTLVLEDDVSQLALSSFIGAFIFSIVAIVALKIGYYGHGGLFVLFVMTLAIFALVVLTFVRWVDSIARLGRLGNTIDKAEAAALQSLNQRRKMPFLGGTEKTLDKTLNGEKILGEDIGYVQHVDMEALQKIAKKHDLWIMVDALPGSFMAPGRAVAVLDTTEKIDEAVRQKIVKAFLIGESRTFEGDPRFGLAVLSEIAVRALSPGINDFGTAIVIIGRFVRLFAQWSEPLDEDEKVVEKFDRVIVPSLSLTEMFDDAFTAIARDGAGAVEVGIRLQKAFAALSTIEYPDMKDEARRHSRLALDRAKNAISLPEDFSRVERYAQNSG